MPDTSSYVVKCIAMFSYFKMISNAYFPMYEKSMQYLHSISDLNLSRNIKQLKSLQIKTINTFKLYNSLLDRPAINIKQLFDARAADNNYQ